MHQFVSIGQSPESAQGQTQMHTNINNKKKTLRPFIDRSRLTGDGHNALLKVLGLVLAELTAELWFETNLGNV